ncbi:hypothetical protein [Tolypothrix sp. NIES-4075]|uniref:hypothetical protein n=1 Tax=Tolypothrix sp. NIES-4075 TaxID=2005459 RepID=UPI00117DB2E9|nr:hypothetical protein [Tolypothrix sp. NIES-4075]
MAHFYYNVVVNFVILSFQELSNILPLNALSFVGSQIILNLSELTEQPINLESSCVEVVVKLMQKLAELTTAVNTARATEDPSKSPIVFASQDLIGSADAPELEFSVRVSVDTKQFANNLIDPNND